jgi:hypothetical protein
MKWLPLKMKATQSVKILAPLTQWHSNHILKTWILYNSAVRTSLFRATVSNWLTQYPRRYSHCLENACTSLHKWHNNLLADLCNTAALGTLWPLLHSLWKKEAAFYLFQKHLLCKEYIRSFSHCGHFWNSTCLAVCAQCFPSYHPASSTCTNHLLTTTPCYTAPDPCVLLIRLYHYYYCHY